MGDRLPWPAVVGRALPFTAGAVAFAVYLASLAPTIGYLDSPELSAAAITLGVPHPTGYPLFIALGHTWTLVSGAVLDADPAWRLNLLNALFASLAIGFVAASGRRLSGRASGGWLAAGCLAYSATFWSQATLVEVYALHLAFAAALVHTWLRFDECAAAGGDPRRFVRTLAVLTGFSLTNHMMTVLVLPVLAVSLLRYRQSFWSLREIASLGVLGLAPLGLYAGLAALAASDPIVNWGNPERIEGLWFHVSGGQYRHNLGQAEGGLLAALLGWPAHAGRELSWWLLALAPIGAWRVGGLRALALALGFVVALVFGLTWGVVDREPFLLNAHLIVALWIGVGAVFVRDGVEARAGRLPGAGVEVALWLAPIVAATVGFAASDRHRDYEAHDHAVAALAALPENAVLITQGPKGYAPVYAQIVEGLRTDVAVVDMYLNVRNSYGPELDRLRSSRLPQGLTRELAVTETVAALDGGSRSLWLMPRVPDNPWHRLGLTRLQGGLVDALVESPPALHAAAPDRAPLADFQGGPQLLGVSTRSHAVESGTAVVVDYTWRVRDVQALGEAPIVTTVLADSSGASPAGRDGMPLLEQRRPFAYGRSPSSLEPDQVVHESVALLVPRAVEPGAWWLWVSVRDGEDWMELPDGRLFARGAALEVTPRTTPLWTLPARQGRSARSADPAASESEAFVR